MLLVAGPNPDFLKFIQVVCWIILPVLVSAVLITIFLHYRKKKKDIAGQDKETEDKVTLAFPLQVGYTNGNGEYVLFDHSDLMRQYRDKLSYNHARYTALQHDFTAIETKYTALAKYAQTHFITNKKGLMENLHEQFPKHLQADVKKMGEEDAMGEKELLNKIGQLEKSYHRLEQENRSLKEQLSLQTASDDEKIAIINKWKEESTLLKEKINEQEYLQDVVEEKKAQVNFLQSQLEQRIKNLYQSEHQRLQAVAEMKKMKEDEESLKNELLLKQEQVDKTQVVLCQKEEQLTEKQQLLNEKIEHIVTLENMFRETKEQNDQLNTSVTDSRDAVNSLQQQLSDEQSKVQFLTQKLFANKQMMRRVYKEFSAFTDDESEESPVILLRPEYTNKENEEIAMH